MQQMAQMLSGGLVISVLNRDDKGLVLILDDRGIVKDKIFSTFKKNIISCENSFVELIDSASIEKYFQLITDLKDNQVVFGREINLKIEGNITTFLISAVRTHENKSMFIISNQLDSILNYYEELMKINNQYVNNIRQVIKERISDKKEDRADSDVYNEMSRLNNEMINLQRKLNKKNIEIEAQKEKYRITLASIGEGVITSDNKGKIKYINPRGEELIGWNLKDAENKPCGEIFELEFPEEDVNGEAAAVDCQKYLTDDGVDMISNWEAFLKKKDGEKFPVEFSISKIKSGGITSGKVIVFRDISERKKAENKLKKFASTDILTEVLNRRAGIDYLQKQMEIAEEREEELSIFFLDVDGLKRINDRYGHLEGDELLKSVGNILQKSLRQHDAVIRLGGDEFLVVMPGTDRKSSEKIWERIAENFKKENKENNKKYKISVSRGTAVYRKDYKLSSDQLINLADERMYKEKEKTSFRQN
ncbi:MAG: diguanylate cyclase [Bacillota bacterium]